MLDFNIVVGLENELCIRIKDTYYIDAIISGSYQEVIEGLPKWLDGVYLTDLLSIVDMLREEVSEISHEIDVDLSYLITPAIIENRIDIVKYLISIGGDVFKYDNLAIINATIINNLDMIKFILEQPGCNSITLDTSVGIACEYGYLETVKYLVSCGANLTSDDNYCLRLATINKHQEVVKYLNL